MYRRKWAEPANFEKIEKLLDFKVIRNLKESLIINRWIPTQSAIKQAEELSRGVELSGV